jgi:hypothetical protein
MWSFDIAWGSLFTSINPEINMIGCLENSFICVRKLTSWIETMGLKYAFLIFNSQYIFLQLFIGPFKMILQFAGLRSFRPKSFTAKKALSLLNWILVNYYCEYASLCDRFLLKPWLKIKNPKSEVLKLNQENIFYW